MKRQPDILYLLLLCLSPTGALRVTVWPSEVSALRGQDAIITCSVSELNLNNPLELVWSRKVKHNSTDVYYYHNGEVKKSTPRYHVTTEEIPNGNATLHISALQFGDEGEYTCAVGNTPEQTEATSTLQVSAQPSVTLTPEILVVELGTERSAMCEATNVYPSTVTISWVRHNKGSPGCVALDKGTCTTDPVTNSDGTFNVTSHLTLNPQKEDDGNRYSCIIKHRSLDKEITRDLTLIVTERPDHTGAIAGAIIGTLLCTLLIMAAVLYYLKMVKKDPPTVSDITGNDELTDMSPATLTCHIMDYRPEDLTISVRLRRFGEQEETTIYTWRSRDPPAPTRETSAGEDTEGTVLLEMEEDKRIVNGKHENRPLRLEMVPVISKKRFGLCSCRCSLHITPSYDPDNGAELSLHVTHPAMTSPICVRRTLRVVGVPPNLMEIVTPGRIQHEEQVTLTCPILGFKPKALSITWLRKEPDGRQSELLTWSPETSDSHNGRYSHTVKQKEHDDNSYNFMSALTLRADIEKDDGVTYICRTLHPATQQQATEELDMVVTAAPLLDSILTVPEVVSVGADMSLSCRIHSFYPRDIQVTWYTEDGQPIESRSAEVLSETGNLHYFTSKATYNPTMRDMGKKFRCEVQHQSLTAPKSITWTLRDLVSPPSVSDIRSDPKRPQSGQLVTLSCEVTDMYPAPQQIQWYRGLTKFPSDQWKEAIKQDPESNMYSGTIELTLTPQSHEHGEKITAEITQSAKIVTKEFILHLKGLPIVSEISSEPLRPEYGRPLTLRCAVTGCDPGDIALYWTQGIQALPGGEVRRDGDDFLYTLTITPTAEDYGKVYSFQVTHRRLPQPITRSHCLRLPEKAPQLSDITVHPVRPRANQEASFRVMISGFCPREIQVRWYKGFSTFPSSAVTSSDPQIGQDSLYTCSTTVTFTPTLSDDTSTIRCEVTHTASKSMQEKRLTLNLSDGNNADCDKSASQGVKTAPVKEEKPMFRIERIECRKECPQVGEEVTLVGRIMGCEAEISEFCWYKGLYPIDGEMENQQHGTSCTSSITFTPQDSNTDCTIRLEVTYNYQTVEESYHLTLG